MEKESDFFKKQISEEKSERWESEKEMPGGKYTPRPIKIGEKYYDHFDPPKLYRDQEGNEEWRGGRELSKEELNEIYADLFWKSYEKDPQYMEDKKRAMIENIESATKMGELCIFGSSRGITEKDKERLSAYRKLAKDLGYYVGEFKFSKKAYTCVAPIEKITKENNS